MPLKSISKKRPWYMAYRPVSSIHSRPFFITVALPAQAEMHCSSLRPREFTNSKAAVPEWVKRLSWKMVFSGSLTVTKEGTTCA